MWNWTTRYQTAVEGLERDKYMEYTLKISKHIPVRDIEKTWSLHTVRLIAVCSRVCLKTVESSLRGSTAGMYYVFNYTCTYACMYLTYYLFIYYLFNLCGCGWPCRCHTTLLCLPEWLPAWWRHSRWSCLGEGQKCLWSHPEYSKCPSSPFAWPLMNFQPKKSKIAYKL